MTRSLITTRYAFQINKSKFHLARHVTSRHDPICSTCQARTKTSVSSRAVRLARHSQNGSTRWTCHVVSRRDEPSGIWAI